MEANFLIISYDSFWQQGSSRMVKTDFLHLFLYTFKICEACLEGSRNMSWPIWKIKEQVKPLSQIGFRNLLGKRQQAFFPDTTPSPPPPSPPLSILHGCRYYIDRGEHYEAYKVIIMQGLRKSSWMLFAMSGCDHIFDLYSHQ